jgi:hypothetical protein
MEARQTLRGSSVPKGLTVVLAACAAVGLAVGAAVVSTELKGSSANQSSTVHAAPGTVLRQDAPAGSALIDRGAEGQAASQAAPILVHGTRSSGSQSIIDNGSVQAADGHGPDSDLTRALPSQAGSDVPTFREGYRY